MNRSGSDPMLLGDLVRDHRRASGLTQQELASRAGLSAGAIRDLEQGRTGRLLPGSLARLATVLGLSRVQIAELQRSPVAGGLLVQVLGPLAVWRAGAPVQVGGAARRAVLGLLTLSPGRLVHRDAVIDALWPGKAPANAVSLVQIQVSRLRRLIDPRGAAGGGSGLLVSAGDSYRLVAGPRELDLLALDELTAEARAAHADGDDEAACGIYEQAVGLWRGEPLADVELLRSHPGVVRLSRQRAEAVIEYARVASSAGRHNRVLGLLRELAAREALNEQAHAQLMIALAGCGQQAEALAVYRDVRGRLDDELAMPPSAELTEAHQRVLRQDVPLARADQAAVSRPAAGAVAGATSAGPAAVAGATSAGPAAVAGATSAGPAAVAGVSGAAASETSAAVLGSRRGAASWVVPRQLPAPSAVFVGREAELEALSALPRQARAGGTVVVSALGGTAGVGKTALAVHWAHQVAAGFPDGQLYVNLRGFDPSAAPVAPADALGWFLDALGVAPEGMPASPEAREGLFRSLVAARRLLIVLDNARDADQVRPLLPGSPGCLVLVTSRAQLSGLAAREGAHLLRLDVLTEEEARQMLAARLGARQAAAERETVTEIARFCACLPLALAITAGRAAARPGLSLAMLAEELRGAASRLDVLDGGDAATSLRAVLSWSYDQLTPGAARMFRLLGMHAGPDISTGAAASLAGIPVAETRQALRELTAVSLLAEHTAGRFAFHDLLRAYAAERARTAEDEQACYAAVCRVLDHYLHTGYTAANLINPARDPIRFLAPRPGVTPEFLAGRKQALAWLQAEHQVLLCAVSLADSSGFDVHAWQIAWTMADFLNWQGNWHQWAVIQRTAVAAATRLGDAAGQAVSLRILGNACLRLGDEDQALAHCTAALGLYQQFGDLLGEARVQQGLALVAENQERYHAALGHAQQALRLYQAIGNRSAEVVAFNNVGWYCALLGDYEPARVFCQRSLTLAAELGLRYDAAMALDSLGYSEHHLGNLAEAARCYQRALSIFREFGDRFNEARILTHLGETRHVAGELAEAREAWQRALDILDDLPHPAADEVRAKLMGRPATTRAR
jgi:DNA-binding SARP family transcriptional activator/tetratricopeptide (TPR) repeat protein/DNA-binding XRE family transcriptional regulator